VSSPWPSFDSVIKLGYLGYLVLSLDNCAIKTYAETSLIIS
jgi:hypothetical protein